MRVSDFVIAALAAGLLAAADASEPTQRQDPLALSTLKSPPEPAVLMREGRFADALIELERLLLAEPGNAGAWLDFALCHYALDHFDESQAIFDAIEREFSPSPAIRAVIAEYRKPKPLLPVPRRWNADLAVLVGHETNANAGVRLGSLTLTFPDTTVATLAIDPRYQAQPSSTRQVEAHADAEMPLGESGVTLLGVGEWRDRRAADAPEFGTRQSQVFAGLRGRLVAANAMLWALWIGQQHASLDGQSLLDNTRVLATLERPVGACQARGGAENERRSYPIQPALDGRYNGVLGSLGCMLGLGQLFVTARHGRDQPEGFRAGGVQIRSELAATLQQPLFQTGRFELTLSHSRQSDRESYSVLLGDIPRRIDRNSLSLEYAQGIGAGWEWTLRGESSAQSSNIELFRIRSSGLSAGLRKRF